MQEEISLRELIETVWNGKWLIVVITAAAVLIAGITTQFVLTPTYEATSTVRIGDGGGEGIPQKLNSFAEALKTDVAYKRIIDKLELDPEQYSINAIRSNTKVEVVKDTNVLRLTVQGEDPQTITNITNLLAFELGARIEITDRSQEIVNLQKRLDQIDNNLAVIGKDLEEAERLLGETPEYLVTRQTLADEPYLHEVVTESSGGSSRDLGALQLESQTINPVYTSLKSRITDNTIELSRLATEKQNIETETAFNNTRIEELERQIDRGKLTSSNSQRLLNGFDAIFISPAIEPTQPVGPKLMLNVAVSLVVGLMIGTLLVFIRHYWKATGRPAPASGDQSVSI